MTHIQSIPLDKLLISPRNARRTGGEDIDDLAASIVAEDGLLQNLVVTEAAGGAFHVEAGGRRLRALQRLQRENRLPASLTDGVPCRIVAADQSGEASLAENVIRVAMHPADAFAAYNDLFKDGKSVDTIAERFGVSTLHVRQRLKLANVAPDLVDAYRTGSDAELTLGCLEALALTDNQQQQRDAWATLRSYERNPTGIRTFLTRGKVRADSGIGAFVGMTEYVAQGGNIERDLFSDVVYLLDRQLLDALALDKLTQLAEEHRAAGWAWAEAKLDCDEVNGYQSMPGHRANVVEKFASEEDERRFREIDARMDEINGMDEDELDDAEKSALIDELSGLEDESEAITERMEEVYPAGTMRQSGVVVTLDHTGKLRLHHGLLRPGEKPNKAKSLAGANGSAAPSTAPPKEPALSEAVRRQLSIHRSETARVHVAEDYLLAQCLLMQQLLSDAHHRFAQTGAHISGRLMASSQNDAQLAPALVKRIDAIFETVNKAKKLSLIDLINMRDADRMKLLAALVAACFDGSTGSDNGHAGIAKLHGMIGFDMADHWNPTVDDFIDRIPGPLVVEAVTEAKGKDAAATLSGMKKAERTATASKLLAGTGWLPKLLRGPTYGKKPKAVAEAKPATKTKTAKKPAAKKAAKKKPVAKKAAKAKAGAK